MRFTEQAYGPVTVVIWWQKTYQAPLFLVSNLDLTNEICYWYRKRMRIETFFSDQKSRGFHLDKSHVAEPDRLTRILLAEGKSQYIYEWLIRNKMIFCNDVTGIYGMPVMSFDKLELPIKSLVWLASRQRSGPSAVGCHRDR